MGDNRIGLAHLHNFFWRLDFDLGGTSNDDFVEELNFNRSSGERQRTTTKFSNEAAREVNPATIRSWRIVDGNSQNSKGHATSYEILLNETGFKDKGPSSEAFTHNDFLSQNNGHVKFLLPTTRPRVDVAQTWNEESTMERGVYYRIMEKKYLNIFLSKLRNFFRTFNFSKF